MMTVEIPELDRQGLRKFGWTTGLIVLVLFGVLLPVVFDIPWPRWPWIFCAILVLWALVAPNSLGPVYRGWMRFGLLLSKITTPIILTLLFIIAILPGAILMRLFRKDPMNRDFDQSPSYRVEAKQPSVRNLEKPF